MNRRKFLTLSVATALALPISVGAMDYRAEKPSAWTAHTVDDAIKALYGDVILIKSDNVLLKILKEVSNGNFVDVGIKTDIEATSISLFQNSNPESAVAVWTVPENGIIDYKLKIKLKTLEGAPSVVTVVVEAKDGKFYFTDTSVVVRGGCEG